MAAQTSLEELLARLIQTLDERETRLTTMMEDMRKDISQLRNEVQTDVNNLHTRMDALETAKKPTSRRATNPPHSLSNDKLQQIDSSQINVEEEKLIPSSALTHDIVIINTVNDESLLLSNSVTQPTSTVCISDIVTPELMSPPTYVTYLPADDKHNSRSVQSYQSGSTTHAAFKFVCAAPDYSALHKIRRFTAVTPLKSYVLARSILY